MIDHINQEAFELVKLISISTDPNSMKNQELTGSMKERGFIDLSDRIIGPMIGRTTDHEGKTIEIFLNKDDTRIGFQKTEYLRFRTLIDNILCLQQFKEIVSFTFIESESFNWIVNVYNNLKAENSLYEYLLDSIDSKVKAITFFFPILNLEIETPFTIGSVEFTYFEKDFFDNLYQEIKDKDETVNEDNFQQLYRSKFQGQVLAKVSVKAENDKAEHIAKQFSEIAVDILKLFSPSAIAPDKKTMFDLNFRLNYQVKSDFLSKIQGDEASLSLNMKFNNPPYCFTDKHSQLASKSGLSIFSDYISLNANNELYKIVIQSIQLFASALSNWDLHLRCVNIITVLESTLLKDEELGDMERKSKARLSKVLSHQHKEKERIKSIFTNIYQVRHKMIHKAIRIDINLRDLSKAQVLIIELFLRLIKLNTIEGIKDKTTLIEKLNKIKS